MLFAQQGPPPPPPEGPIFTWFVVAALVAILGLLTSLVLRRRDGSIAKADGGLAEEVRHLRWRVDGLERDIEEVRRTQSGTRDDRIRP